MILDIEKSQQPQKQYHQPIHSPLNDLDVDNQIEHVEKFIRDKNFAKISILVLFITIIGFILSEILFYLKIADIELSIVALFGAGLLYSLTKQRKEILLSVDYPTLIFFISMFIVTFSLWHSGAITNLIQIFSETNIIVIA